MKEIDKKIILALQDRLPSTIREIASIIDDTGKSICRFEQKIRYHVNSMVDAGIIFSIETENQTTLFRLEDNVEILEGYITLKDKDGNIKYENETLGKVMRMTDADGDTAISILDM